SQECRPTFEVSIAERGTSSAGLKLACFAGPSRTRSSAPSLTDPVNPEAVKTGAFRSAVTRERFLRRRHDLVPFSAQPSEFRELPESSQPESHIQHCKHRLATTEVGSLDSLQLHPTLQRSWLASPMCFLISGVLCTINPLGRDLQTLSAWDGSCVVIPCSIQKKIELNLGVKIISLIWYFDPVYDNILKDYNGTMLFNASVPGNHKITTSPNFAGRVRFVGDLKQRNCSLKISQLRKNDSGTYLPRLYGLIDHKTETFKWKIHAPVNVMETPPKPTISSQEVVERQSTKVSCSVPYHCPDEPLRLTLSLEARDGRQVASREANEIGKIQTTLTFEPTWEDHGKTLTCLLSHQDESVISQNSLLLNVNHAPQSPMIKATPGRTIRAGERLSLECTIESSYPMAEYQWYKDSARLSQRTGSKIEFDPIEEGDAGTYKCKVSNKVGYRENQLTIAVQYLPKDTRVTGAAQVIHEGNEVVLCCSSRGVPPVDRYEWYKGLTQSSPYRKGLELRFDAIHSGDSGTYYCVAHNRLGNSSSPPVVLDVLYPPKNVKLTNQSPLPIKEGNSVMLNCSVGSSNPPVHRYKWSRNMRGNTVEGSLLIFSATPRDVGPYSCEACNSVKCITSMTIYVDVLYGPKDVSITQEPKGRILEGSQVRLNCNVGPANPKDLTYVWYKDDLQLSSADATWTISKAVPDDSGTYSCEARNSVGKSQSSTVTLDVLCE
ncbi:hypothetical protein lerEdw1_009628, partial [Lerista edwardsae]